MDRACQTARARQDLFWRPRETVYVLSLIHLGSRKAYLRPNSCNAGGEWMLEQARNVSMWAEDEGIDVRFLTYDRGSKVW